MSYVMAIGWNLNGLPLRQRLEARLLDGPSQGVVVTTDLTRLKEYLARIPDTRVIGASEADDDPWWVMLKIDISSPLAWHVVQELGHVLNYLSATERLPCVFKPISPAPYLNEGADEYLRWLIEATEDDASPDLVAEFLEGRLPRPVEDRSKWP